MRSQLSIIGIGRGSRPRLRWLLSLGVVAPLLGAAASSGRAAEVLVTNDNSHVWSARAIAVNPKNPDNIVMPIMAFASTKACADEAKTDPKSACAEMEVTPFGNMKTRPIGMITNVPGFTMGSAWTSLDRGKTWTKSAEVREGGNIAVFPPDRWRGPALADAVSGAVTPDGTFHLVWDATRFADVPGFTDMGGIIYSKSTDGGRNWSEPTVTGLSLDGSRIFADPITGTLYDISSGPPGPSAFSLADTKVLISKENPPTGMAGHIRWSKDGRNWSAPLIIGGGGNSMAAAHGTLATAFRTTGEQNNFGAGRSPPNGDLCGKAPKPCLIFQTAKEGSGKWTRAVVSLPNEESGNPAVAADPTKAGQFAMVFQRGAEFHVYRTKDSGMSWSKPTIVADMPGKAPSGVSVAYGPTGALAMAWTSRDESPDAAAGGGQGGQSRSPYNVVAAISKDGGAMFSQPLKINTTKSPAPPTGRSIGIGRDGSATIVLTRENAFLAWTDWKTGEGKVMFNALDLGEFK